MAAALTFALPVVTGDQNQNNDVTIDFSLTNSGDAACLLKGIDLYVLPSAGEIQFPDPHNTIIVGTGTIDQYPAYVRPKEDGYRIEPLDVLASDVDAADVLTYSLPVHLVGPGSVGIVITAEFIIYDEINPFTILSKGYLLQMGIQPA